MAKKQAFGAQAQQMKAAHRRMAKVVITTKNKNGKYSYREAMVDQESAREFIEKNKS